MRFFSDVSGLVQLQPMNTANIFVYKCHMCESVAINCIRYIFESLQTISSKPASDVSGLLIKITLLLTICILNCSKANMQSYFAVQKQQMQSIFPNATPVTSSEDTVLFFILNCCCSDTYSDTEFIVVSWQIFTPAAFP